MGSYYDLLGLPADASEMEIRSAYGRDVLRLQNAPPRNLAQIRATLDEALATLTDPEKRSAYDAALSASAMDAATMSADASDDAFTYARNGGLWFAGGGLVTAATYAFLEGGYLLAWGPLIFGGFQLLRGLVAYLQVPSGARRASQMLTLAGLVAVGVLSAGFVAVSEGQAAQGAVERDHWNSMIEATTLEIDQANALVDGVANRPGGWESQDSTDMGKASTLFASVADTVARASVPARLEWYRAAMAQNFREAASITHQYAQLSATSPASAFEALGTRWNARIDQLNELSDRFEAQEGKSR